MVVDAVMIDETFCFTLTRDDSDSKTEFYIKPLTQFESLKVSGIYQKFLGDISGEEDSGKLMELFASDKSEVLENILEKFLKTHIKEIKNFRIKGELKNLKGNEIKVDLIDLMDVFDLLSQTVAKISIPEQEEKN